MSERAASANAGETGMADAGSIPEGESSRELEAEVWAAADAADGVDVRVTVYVVTGRHGWLTVPESFCRECHLFVRAADVAAERVDADVDVRVVSWWTHFPWALLRGGYHPPVMVVGGTRLCQGEAVPTPEEVVAAIEAELDG